MCISVCNIIASSVMFATGITAHTTPSTISPNVKYSVLATYTISTIAVTKTTQCAIKHAFAIALVKTTISLSHCPAQFTKLLDHLDEVLLNLSRRFFAVYVQ